MADSNPHVSVFHFTSRISSAKIRKYKLATERGMASRPVEATTQQNPEATSSGNVPQTSSFYLQSSDSNSTEHVAKRPRLRDSTASDNMSSQAPAARPSRTPTYRIRYSENMTVDSNNKLSIQTFPDAREQVVNMPPAPTIVRSAQAPPPVLLPPAASRATREAPSRPAARNKTTQYGDSFASYYITGEPDEDDVVEVRESNSKSARSIAKTALKARPEILQPLHPQRSQAQHKVALAPAPQPPPARPSKPIQRQQPALRHQQQYVPPHQDQKLSPQVSNIQPVGHIPMPLQPQLHPNVTVIDDLCSNLPPRQPDTVETIILKLQNLCAALATFGGVPADPNAPKEGIGDVAKEHSQQHAQPESPNEEKKDDQVDNLLAMFGDDDSEEGVAPVVQPPAEPAIQDPSIERLNQPFEQSGDQDIALTYGIQFIQNALRSWAIQRLTTQYTQHYYHAIQQAQAPPPKRGPGRPRKFDSWDDSRAQPRMPASNVQMLLSGTPEGVAVAAFQDVLESGCIQTGVVLPMELSRALRKLYMQIDHLINSNSVTDSKPRWRCMSYASQIKAHRARVESWKENHAIARTEMARQQFLARQHMMQQMGMKPPEARAPQSHHSALATKQPARSSQHSDLSPERTTSQVPAHSSPRPGSVAGHGSQHSHGRVVQSSFVQKDMQMQNGSKPVPKYKSTSEIYKNRTQENGQQYMSNYLPRSGQSMKFSFAPDNQQAIKAFGAKAFPKAKKVDDGSNGYSSDEVIPSKQTTVVADRAGGTFKTHRSDERRELVKAGRRLQAVPADESDTIDHRNGAREETISPHNSPPIVTHGFTAVNAVRPRSSQAAKTIAAASAWRPLDRDVSMTDADDSVEEVTHKASNCQPVYAMDIDD